MNILKATIHSITSSEHLSYIEVSHGEDIFSLFLVEKLDLEKHLGKEINLAFKETEVILAKESILSTANCATATVSHISKGDLFTQVTLLYSTDTITALVATLSFERLHVNQNDTVTWIVQPSEISLLWTNDGF